MNETGVIVTLVGGIVSLVGVVVWAGKFLLTKITYAIEKNTEASVRVEKSISRMENTLIMLIDRTPVVGETTARNLRKEMRE